MGTSEDLVFTFKPEQLSIAEVANNCRHLRDETPIDELPTGDWDRENERYREKNFERDRLVIQKDEAFQQVYVAGRTHTPPCQQAWREWFVNGAVGDGTLAIVLSHEVDYEGFGWIYEWNSSTNGYRPLVSDPGYYNHIDGEKSGFGAIAAHRIHDIADIRPARYWDGELVRWDESGRREGGFIPDHYFRSRENPPDPR